MSKTPRNQPRIEPLSVGNAVSGALRLYRDRFKLYCTLALTGYLWVLIPIYGWAKCSAIFAMISRLAFAEVMERPETVESARRQVDPKKWRLLGAGILISLIFLGALIGATIAFTIVGVTIGVAIGSQNAIAGTLVGILVGTIAFLVGAIGYLWLFSRLSVVELPIAIEENLDAAGGISRSWELTKYSAWRIVGVFLLAYLITLPIVILLQLLDPLLRVILSFFLIPETGLYVTIHFILLLLISLGSGVVLVPFWQALKAMIYYDLRARREGLGLELQDTDAWES
ncbi:DUF975 domain-containing protein [Phormidium sp. CCY1219]|uniref:DUF975 domain-containing protein n=1 Tax=Phormidium sp. CCY1219 TaxID=2886104 RepID=UPI002D1F2569|nr:DUF975 domain-containing protein [Phormidium sp. CCY1219]MEB3831030.1 DUF975 domain-containing protein [Phormidium sp. CCY1219]